MTFRPEPQDAILFTPPEADPQDREEYERHMAFEFDNADCGLVDEEELDSEMLAAFPEGTLNVDYRNAPAWW